MPVESPFKFLDAYDKADKEIFFGREKETEILYEKVFRSKFVLVYGASGIGKTSLINCGLANRFADTDWYELFIRRQGDINLSIRNALIEAIHQANRFARKKARQSLPDFDASIPELVQSLYLRCFKPIFLVFDQFEELFILGSPEEKLALIETFKGLGEEDINCNLIIIMREEYLADLDDFETEIPYFLANRMRVEALSRLQTETVVRQTVTAPRFGIDVIDPEVTLPLIVEKVSDGRKVQLAYLQVYLDRLYREGSREGGTQFSPDLVARTGALGDVMRLFLDEQMHAVHQSLKEVAPDMSLDRLWQLMGKFVTLDGTKQPIAQTEVYEQLRSFEPELVDLSLQELVNSRILRLDDDVYEVAHDSLANRIAENISLEDRKLREAKTLIVSRHQANKLTGVFLIQKELAFLDLYEDQLELDPDEKKFLAKSRKQAQRQRQRLIGAVLLFLLVAGLAGIAAWNANEANLQKDIVELQADDLKESRDSIQQSKNSLEQSQDSLLLSKSKVDNLFGELQVTLGEVQEQKDLAARRSLAFQEVAKALKILPEDPSTAFNYALKGWQIDPNPITRKALFDIFGAQPLNKKLLKKGPGNIPIAVSSNGEYFAINPLKNRTQLILENAKSEKISSFEAFDYINQAIFSPDNQFLLVGTDDGAYLWDLRLKEEKPLRLIHPKDEDIDQVIFLKSGKEFLTGSRSGKWYKWSINDSSYQALSNTEASPILQQQKKMFSVGKNNQIRYGDDYITFVGHTAEPVNLSPSIDNKFLYSSAKDGTVRKWAIPAVLQAEIPIKEGRLMALEFDNKKRVLRLGTNFGDYMQFSLNGESLSLPQSIPYGIDEVMDFSAEGLGFVGIGEDNKKIGQFYPGQGEHILFKGHEKKISAISISNNNRLIASGSFDQTIKLWRNDGDLIASLEGHQGTISSLTFSKDGSRLLSGSLDNTARLWSARGNPLVVLEHKDRVTAVDISPDKSRLLTGSKDQSIRIWTRSGRLIKQIEDHQASITVAKYSPDGKWILSGDANGEVRMWDAAGNLHLVLQFGVPIEAIDFLSNSDLFAIGTRKLVYIWKHQKSALMDYIKAPMPSD